MCHYYQVPEKKAMSSINRHSPADEPSEQARETSEISDRACVAAAGGKVTFEEALRELEQEMEKDFEANRAAERLSAEDFAVRINAKA